MKEYNEQVVETLDDAGCIIANKNIIIDNLQARIAELEAESLIAEIAKQNKPVAWWNGKETAFFEHETDGPVGEVKIPLYTFPPTAEQIANETAWRPIETAPKDGRELILLLTPSNWPQVAYSNTWWQGGFSVENKPTHWMPLPKAPNGASS